ncbi:gliding motility-associated C-terminal domain-containing protein [Maribacter sp. PR1]|uniref:Gliding motility-associated C-terminal domain-containing protein n=1 Tax=Maribacter cobaltidurans TaxID=1178778 RepID=A0ABU7IX56_9FLAO|nr:MULTISPECIES: gliding motility-associated C-terminal domain-containing protein [Maribacter]MDC6390187.1 gliding motility-associated C-terminal domain-containing protein [Maribacter sp. PR1]MEE1977577.1 gliding motility-associated C-terminal domain-containing protein [Maribacter cobaltidurans]
MNKYLNIFLFFSLMSLSAQTALFNNGNIRIHEGGNLGFHTDLINDSPFDDNSGLAGFYGTDLAVFGNVVPLFYDVEVAVDNDLILTLGLDTRNNTNFILGDIYTPKSNSAVYYNFLANAFYNGESDLTKVNGYAAITNQQNFMFPVGDVDFLRPLTLNSESANPFAKCAYFFDDPNSQAVFPGNFNTSELDIDVEAVSSTEFWRLEGSLPSTVSISWNERSNLSTLTDDATKIIVVGWSKASQRWINLEASTVTGSLEQGFVTTKSFTPDDYEILTLGVSKIPYEPLEKEVLTLDNFLVSANGDGINDSFYVEELEQSPNNMVRIYDRYGLKVFEKSNYVNEFVGVSNINNFVISREDGLPEGVYFFTIDMLDLDLSYQGFLYLAR